MAIKETLEVKQIRQRIDAVNADMTGSSFNDVALARTTFHNVNLAGAHIHNSDLSNGKIDDATLAGMQITNANLTNVSITDSLTDGMTIDGIAVAELMGAYQAANRKREMPAASDEPFLAG